MKTIILRSAAVAFALALVVVGQAGLAKADDKISICHATGDPANPFVYITISFNGLHGHEKHSGDLIPAPNPECVPDDGGGGQV